MTMTPVLTLMTTMSVGVEDDDSDDSGVGRDFGVDDNDLGVQDADDDDDNMTGADDDDS